MRLDGILFGWTRRLSLNVFYSLRRNVFLSLTLFMGCFLCFRNRGMSEEIFLQKAILRTAFWLVRWLTSLSTSANRKAVCFWKQLWLESDVGNWNESWVMIRKSFRYFYFVDFRIFWICKILYFTLIINADSNYFSWCYFMGSNRSRKGSLWQLLRKIFSSFQLLRKSFPEHVLTYFFLFILNEK